MFERQKVPIFGFWFHLISKTIEISIVDSYEFESKKKKRNDAALYYTIFFDFNGTVLHADANYDVWRL